MYAVRHVLPHKLTLFFSGRKTTMVKTLRAQTAPSTMILSKTVITKVMYIFYSAAHDFVTDVPYT